jgi:hypothetical protein
VLDAKMELQASRGLFVVLSADGYTAEQEQGETDETPQH